MSLLPEQREQILTTHAAFICQVVTQINNPALRGELDELLQAAQQQGWNELVTVIRKIADGARDERLVGALDAEDAVIADAILRGLQDPATLPDPNARPDPSMAAPGLAHMIHAARSDPQALVLLSNMAEQMSRAGGEMAQLAAIIRPLINGERDPERLCSGMGARGSGVVLGILDELAKLQSH